MFPVDQIIHCKSYQSICDQNWSVGDKVTGQIIHVDLDSIPQFFEEIKSHNKKYIVVSSCCDWFVVEQRREPAWLDYVKSVRLFVRPEHTYIGLQLGPRLNLERCNPQHKYSIKCYSYTTATFPEIPTNVVKWFTTNKVIEDERIVGIPFGVNNVDMDFKAVNALAQVKDKGIDSRAKIYCNWQFYTGERLDLYTRLDGHPECVCERDIEFGPYITNMQKCIGTICPLGNGPDCYRTLESLYLGCVPLLTTNFQYGYECYGNLVKEFEEYMLTPHYYDEIKTFADYYDITYPQKHERLYLNYWVDLIKSSTKYA